jgi:hypothetical protein
MLMGKSKFVAQEIKNTFYTLQIRSKFFYNPITFTLLIHYTNQSQFNSFLRA